MDVYAIFDQDGLPKGFYTPIVHSHIPHGAVRISKEQWHELIGHKGRRRWDGEKVVEYAPPPCSGPGISTLLGQALDKLGEIVVTFKRLTR